MSVSVQAVVDSAERAGWHRVTCPRCGCDVGVLGPEGICETCTRLDLSFELSSSRQHAKRGS